MLRRDRTVTEPLSTDPTQAAMLRAARELAQARRLLLEIDSLLQDAKLSGIVARPIRKRQNAALELLLKAEHDLRDTCRS